MMTKHETMRRLALAILRFRKAKKILEAING